MATRSPCSSLISSPVKVRLHGVDAPKSKQAFGTRAKQEVSALVFGKDVRVKVVKKGSLRTHGRTRVRGRDLSNVEMARRGFAWSYREYAKGDTELATAEAVARNAKRGLWADKEPIPPWEFQMNGKAAARAT